MENPEELIDYARGKAYFGAVGDDRTAYPGIRDRLPSVYEQVLGEAVSLVFGARKSTINRCMLSLTTLNSDQLSTAQKMPHVDALGDDQFASVHYLCDSSHGGTAIYRYRPKNIVRLRDENHSVILEMMKKAGANSVRAICTHPVLSGKAYENIEKSVIEELIISDTLPINKKCSKIKVLTISTLFADVIKSINQNKSISSQFLI